MQDQCDREVIICPFTIVIDTREQAPWSFFGIRANAKEQHRQIVVDTVRETLQTGDYSIRGLEFQVCIERKSIDDLYGTILGGRARFKRELERMQSFDFSLVLVEGDWRENPPQQARDTGDEWRKRLKTVENSLIAWRLQYPRTHWDYVPSVRWAEMHAFRVLEKFWHHYQNYKNNKILSGASRDTTTDTGNGFHAAQHSGNPVAIDGCNQSQGESVVRAVSVPCGHQSQPGDFYC